MGAIILSSGASVKVDELQHRQVNMSVLLRDLTDEKSYTDSFKIAIICVLGRLGKYGDVALTKLKELADGSNELLSQAAKQAISKITEGKVSIPVVTPPPPPVVTSRIHSDTSTSYFGGNHINYAKKDLIKVSIEDVNDDLNDESLKGWVECYFCEKNFIATKQMREFNKELSFDKKIYCNFCLRNNLNTRRSNDVMIMSVRGLPAYYYYSYHYIPKNSTIFVADIREMCDLHARIGSQNPTMVYDEESFCWFIDFRKINNQKLFDELLKTIVNMLSAFNIYDCVPCASPHKYFKKFEIAITEFYKSRTRIWDKKVFVPTLWDCDIPTDCPANAKPIPIDLLHNFSAAQLVDKSQRK